VRLLRAQFSTGGRGVPRVFLENAENTGVAEKGAKKRLQVIEKL
jgi:hypothetical protein